MRLLALLSLVALTGCSVFGIRSEYNQPDYTVTERITDDFEVRRYSERLAAEASVAADATDDGRNAAFRLLFAYISGENTTSDKVAMTVPVEMSDPAAAIEMTVPVETSTDQSGTTMRFFLPGAYIRETAPAPTNERVKIVTTPAQTMAVLQFTGSTERSAVAEKTDDLLKRLETSSWRPVAAPVSYFYDPPWTLPFLRRNEVAVAVEPR